MTDRFSTCLAFVLQEEGGFSDTPGDHGGATDMGILQREYDAYRKAKKLAPQSVRHITRAEAAEIYRTNFWNPMGCDALGAPIDLVMFDTAVNMGIGEARKILARHPGGAGYTSAQRAANIIRDRVAVYRVISTHPAQGKFLDGWLNRMTDLAKACGVEGVELA